MTIFLLILDLCVDGFDPGLWVYFIVLFFEIITGD